VSPELSTDENVNINDNVDVIYTQDARDMKGVADNSVALVVTSPPYFAGKQYEEVLGVAGVPADYFEYLAMLEAVFAECKRVLEPGGRIAVNVANLGRRPYRSLSSDVVQILQDLGLLLRGEVIWWKGRAAGGSCAWGTFQRPNNPVLRDVTERVIIASKGRFDRARTARQREQEGLPSVATISREEFLEATTDLWELPPESATRVNHPAPFPIELPQRLIELYTYEDDVVLDPFMGSGSTAVAAVRTDRHFIGFDTDDDYAKRSRKRVKDEQEARVQQLTELPNPRIRLTAGKGPADADPRVQAVNEGRMAKEVAQVLLEQCGFSDIQANVRVPRAGTELTFTAKDTSGREWGFDVSGAFTTTKSGLRRADTLWKTLGKAAALASVAKPRPLILLTTDLPAKASPGNAALSAVTGPGKQIEDVIDLTSDADRQRLAALATPTPAKKKKKSGS
jgi:DNA modification methylase